MVGELPLDTLIDGRNAVFNHSIALQALDSGKPTTRDTLVLGYVAPLLVRHCGCAIAGALHVAIVVAHFGTEEHGGDTNLLVCAALLLLLLRNNGLHRAPWGALLRTGVDCGTRCSAL